MKKRELVVGETYKTSRYLKAVYLGDVKMYRTGGSFIRRDVIGSEHGVPTPAFAVSYGHTNEVGWSPEFLSLQTIECTWAQWEAMRERQRIADNERAERARRNSLRRKQQAQTLARLLGPGVSVEVDQFGYAQLNAQELIDRLTVKVSA
jgi:hypothetical protein